MGSSSSIFHHRPSPTYHSPSASFMPPGRMITSGFRVSQPHRAMTPPGKMRAWAPQISRVPGCFLGCPAVIKLAPHGLESNRPIAWNSRGRGAVAPRSSSNLLPNQDEAFCMSAANRPHSTQIQQIGRCHLAANQPLFGGILIDPVHLYRSATQQDLPNSETCRFMDPMNDGKPWRLAPCQQKIHSPHRTQEISISPRIYHSKRWGTSQILPVE